MGGLELPGVLKRGKSEAENDRQFASTLGRGMDVLRCFTAAQSVLGNKDIALRTGLPKPTVSRLTYTLTSLGYLRHLPRIGKYELGSAVLAIGYPLLANIPVRQRARVEMIELAEYSRGWVSLGMRERLNMVYIETARSREVLDSKPDIGQTFPILMSAMGRAYLAGLDALERDAVLNHLRVKAPEQWAKHSCKVESSLEDFRARGFCMHHGDFNPHVHTVAVPMRRRGDADILVFNCAVPIQVLQRGQLESDVGPRLVAMVKAVEAGLDRH
ncbi:MAG: IclR family transcriptional regulator [Lautropia sp.]